MLFWGCWIARSCCNHCYNVQQSISATWDDVRPGWRESWNEELPLQDWIGLAYMEEYIQCKSSCTLLVAAHTVLLSHHQHTVFVLLVEPLQGRNPRAIVSVTYLGCSHSVAFGSWRPNGSCKERRTRRKDGSSSWQLLPGGRNWLVFIWFIVSSSINVS